MIESAPFLAFGMEWHRDECEVFVRDNFFQKRLKHKSAQMRLEIAHEPILEEVKHPLDRASVVIGCDDEIVEIGFAPALSTRSAAFGYVFLAHWASLFRCELNVPFTSFAQQNTFHCPTPEAPAGEYVIDENAEHVREHAQSLPQTT